MLYWTCWRTVLVGISTESVLELGFERLSIAGRFEGNVAHLNLRGCVGEGSPLGTVFLSTHHRSARAYQA